MEVTIVEYFGSQRSSHCGYCETNTPDKFTHGMWAHRMTVEDYQDLIDRGFRRSGQYCYKPTLNKTCCPQYTIRCDVNAFKPSRSHKRNLKRFNRFIAAGEIKGPARSKNQLTSGSGCNVHEKPVSAKLNDIGDDHNDSDAIVKKSAKANAKRVCRENEAGGSGSIVGELSSGQLFRTEKDVINADFELPRKAKEMRRLKKLSKLAAKGIDPNTWKKKVPVVKTVEDFLNESPGTNAAHKFQLRLVRSHPPDATFAKTLAESYAVYFGYQRKIHGDPPEKPTERQFRRFLCDSPLHIRILRIDEGVADWKASVGESFELFREYQMKIHGDERWDCDWVQFRAFLVDTPLNYKSGPVAGHPGYGSFHQQYLLDGKIIAVAVMDILPKCISSKYFYYDPTYHFLVLGTNSALREISFTKQLSRLTPELKYYYMGFYIHGCQKMRYKGQYSASYLLCPESYLWCPLEKCVPKLDKAKYSRFDETNAEDQDAECLVDDTLCLFERKAVRYDLYRTFKAFSDEETRRSEDEVQEYARLVGRRCAARMLLYRD